jgi:hypothetical protein
MIKRLDPAKNGWKRALARWLDPEAHQVAEQFDWLFGKIMMERHWFNQGEHPGHYEALERLYAMTVDRYRDLGSEPLKLHFPTDISLFREWVSLQVNKHAARKAQAMIKQASVEVVKEGLDGDQREAGAAVPAAEGTADGTVPKKRRKRKKDAVLS